MGTSRHVGQANARAAVSLSVLHLGTRRGSCPLPPKRPQNAARYSDVAWRLVLSPEDRKTVPGAEDSMFGVLRVRRPTAKPPER